MRFLFSSLPGVGHMRLALHLGEGLKAAGHDVAIATASFYGDLVCDAGLEFIRAGLEWDFSQKEKTVPEVVDIPKAKQEDYLWLEVFLKRSPELMIPDLVNAIGTWQADALINDVVEVGGIIAAEKAGVPYACYHPNLMYWTAEVAIDQMLEPLTALRDKFGVAPDPECRAYGRYLDLCFFPNSSWTQVETGGRPVHFFQPLQPGTAARSDKWSKLDNKPLVMVGLGSVLGPHYLEVFETTIAALADEDLNVVMTLGCRAFDISHFGEPPSNIHIEPYLEHGEFLGLLERACCLINHGGYNTAIEGLFAGVPQVMLPFGADQPVTYGLCKGRKVAVEIPEHIMEPGMDGPVVNPAKLTPEILRRCVLEVVNKPEYGNAAREVQTELQNLPGRERAVELLEQMVESHRDS